MTLRDKYMALLADLVEEREKFGERWVCYYDGKIAELNAAIEQRFGGGCYEGGKSEGVLPDEGTDLPN